MQLVDLYPTILDLLGIELSHALHGRTLRPLLSGETLPERAAFAEKVNITAYERKGLRTPDYKFIHSFPQPATREQGMKDYVELYDLRRDPGETRDIAAARPDLVERIRRIMEQGRTPSDLFPLPAIDQPVERPDGATTR